MDCPTRQSSNALPNFALWTKLKNLVILVIPSDSCYLRGHFQHFPNQNFFSMMVMIITIIIIIITKKNPNLFFLQEMKSTCRDQARKSKFFFVFLHFCNFQQKKLKTLQIQKSHCSCPNQWPHPHSEHFMCILNRWALQGPLDFNRYSLQRKSKFGAFFLNFTIQWRWCFCNQNSTKMTQNGIVPLAPEILLAPKLRWTCHLRGSHGLSARRAWKTKSSRPEGPKEWPKATS